MAEYKNDYEFITSLFAPFIDAQGGPRVDDAGLAVARATDEANAKEAARLQTLINRPDQVDQFGNRLTWTTGPDGKMTQTISLSPQEQARYNAATGFGLDLMGQARGLFGGPNFSGLPGLSSGDDARNRAESALFNRMSARLDPMWQRREESLQQRLINQGLDPSSEAARNASREFNTARNDAYSSALNDAIAGGGAEAQRVFGMDLSRRGQLANELLGGYNAQLSGLGMGLNAMRANMPGGTQFGGFMGGSVAQPRPYEQQFLHDYGMDVARFQRTMDSMMNAASIGADLGSSAVGMGFGMMPTGGSAPRPGGQYMPYTYGAQSPNLGNYQLQQPVMPGQPPPGGYQFQSQWPGGY